MEVEDRVWVMLYCGRCNEYCDDPSLLNDENELCTNDGGCDFCPKMDEMEGGVARAGTITGVFRSVDDARSYFRQNIDRRPTTEAVSRTFDGQAVLWYWLFTKDSEERSATVHLLSAEKIKGGADD